METAADRGEVVFPGEEPDCVWVLWEHCGGVETGHCGKLSALWHKASLPICPQLPTQPVTSTVLTGYSLQGGSESKGHTSPWGARSGRNPSPGMFLQAADLAQAPTARIRNDRRNGDPMGSKTIWSPPPPPHLPPFPPHHSTWESRSRDACRMCILQASNFFKRK
ncbi:hypothetical protein SKAU_G00006740 [Synaphobranchus kaupii]|uniref:Uncharacterized protein n=1 Tax=Synaphobranchus kaupii TaxID=118154 RepID=A0A9Q1GAF3_SYNKA|nr:hypothetical protein SKAU_G00006740 [Synaphobranchus kaupii]